MLFFYAPMTTNIKKKGSYSICQNVLFIQKFDWWHLGRASMLNVVTFDLESVSLTENTNAASVHCTLSCQWDNIKHFVKTFKEQWPTGSNNF